MGWENARNEAGPPRSSLTSRCSLIRRKKLFSIAFLLSLALTCSIELALLIMDPASTVGLAADTVTLLKLLSKGVLSANAMLHGVRDVHENTRGFGEGLDAFHFLLTVLDFEIRNGNAVVANIQRPCSRFEPNGNEIEIPCDDGNTNR